MRDLPLEWESDDSGYTCCCSLQTLANRMVKLFTPSFADRSNINAQNMAVKGGVTRVDSLRPPVEASLAHIKQDWGSFDYSYAWRA